MTNTNPSKFPTLLPSNSALLGLFPAPQPQGGSKKSHPIDVQTTSEAEPPTLKPFSDPFGNFDLLLIKWRPAPCFIFRSVQPQRSKACFGRCIFISNDSIHPVKASSQLRPSLRASGWATGPRLKIPKPLDKPNLNCKELLARIQTLSLWLEKIAVLIC